MLRASAAAAPPPAALTGGIVMMVPLAVTTAVGSGVISSRREKEASAKMQAPAMSSATLLRTSGPVKALPLGVGGMGRVVWRALARLRSAAPFLPPISTHLFAARRW